jgi:hypothetical protein
MKPPVKTLVFLTIYFFSLSVATAQFGIKPTTGIAPDIKKVIDDYPNHFDNILGELIIQNPQSTDYECNFKVNGAQECTITRYSGKKTPVTSWRALMLSTVNFEEAKRKFRSLYNELNNLSKESMQLKGTYESPAEEKNFTSILFSFDPPAESIKKLRVELVMEAEGMDWKVKVLVYDRSREDDERDDREE